MGTFVSNDEGRCYGIVLQEVISAFAWGPSQPFKKRTKIERRNTRGKSQHGRAREGAYLRERWPTAISKAGIDAGRFFGQRIVPWLACHPTTALPRPLEAL
jgi:hypothetical protein